MPIVSNTILDPAGDPIANAAVVVRLVAAEVGMAPGFRADKAAILGEWGLRTGVDGAWSVTLTANDSLTPDGTYYTVSATVRGRTSVVAFVVPADAGPYELADIFVVSPTAPGLVSVTPGQMATADAAVLAAALAYTDAHTGAGAIPVAAANSGASYTVTAPTHGEKRLKLTLTGSPIVTLSGGTVSEVCAVQLHLIQDATGSRTVTWPSNLDWGINGAPVLSTVTGKTDQVYLTTDDGGSSWQGALIGNGYTLPVAPSAPTTLAGSVVSGDVVLTWTQGAANRSVVTQNKIYRRVTAGSYALLTTITANTTYADTTPLTDGTSYDYKVAAVNAIGESAQSNEYTVVPGLVVIASDNFNRADDTATGPSDGLIGDVTPVGAKTWVNNGGSNWSVTSNKADPVSGAFGIATINSGVSDCTVSVDIAVTGSTTNEALMFRYVDANNYCAVVLDPSGLILQKKIAGVQTNVATALGGAIGSGFTGRIGLKASGSTIKVYKDGVQVGADQTISDAAVLTATKHGFASGSATTMTFDNFEVTVP